MKRTVSPCLTVSVAGDLAQGRLKLQREPVVRTLAEPTLTAVSGEPANFLAGGEFPIPLSQGLGTTSIEVSELLSQQLTEAGIAHAERLLGRGVLGREQDVVGAAAPRRPEPGFP